MYPEEDWRMISEIQHFSFCRRQWALIHLEQQWQDNLRTVEGELLHEKAHTQSAESRGDVVISRAMPVFSAELGVRGVCDVVEFHRDEEGAVLRGRKGRFRPVPVEYKRGKAKPGAADELQLCAQAMCLEEMLLCGVPVGYLFYGETRRRQEVVFDMARRQGVKDNLAEMHQYAKRGYTPKVKQGTFCNACSLKDLCLPKLCKNKSAVAYIKKELREGKEL